MAAHGTRTTPNEYSIGSSGERESASKWQPTHTHTHTYSNNNNEVKNEHKFSQEKSKKKRECKRSKRMKTLARAYAGKKVSRIDKPMATSR